MTPDFTWTWWAERDRAVVGPLGHEQFAEDMPVVTVRTARDAAFLVAVLDYLNAEAVQP